MDPAEKDLIIRNLGPFNKVSNPYIILEFVCHAANDLLEIVLVFNRSCF